MSSITTDFSNVGASLANITGDINQFVVAPLAAFGIGGFVFQAAGEAMGRLSADITDHYTEDNRSVQDHIAIRPKRITLKGYVGELFYNGPGGGGSALNTLAQKLVEAASLLPTITATATQIQTAITNPSSPNFPTILGDASNIYGIVQNVLGAFGDTKNQQNAYTYFKALMNSATLMGIQTPWEFMTNMAIENITAMQPEASMWITDFSITLKEIRIAKTMNVPQSNASAQAGAQGTTSTAQTGTPAVLAPIAQDQQAAITNKGNTVGVPQQFGASGSWSSAGATGSF